MLRRIVACVPIVFMSGCAARQPVVNASEAHERARGGSRGDDNMRIARAPMLCGADAARPRRDEVDSF
jgi:hypothetical protein